MMLQTDRQTQPFIENGIMNEKLPQIQVQGGQLHFHFSVRPSPT